MGCPPGLHLRPCLEALVDDGVTDVVSMLPREEAAELGVDGEAEVCAALGLRFRNHPIPDFSLPDLTAFGGLIEDMAARLAEGGHIAVHCRAGIGRSGMVAAATLVRLGAEPGAALAEVSAARGVPVPDTEEQAAFVTAFARAVASNS